MGSKRCPLRRERGKFACLVCPLPLTDDCVLDKPGMISDIDRESLLIMKIKLRDKVYDPELREWVANKETEEEKDE